MGICVISVKYISVSYTNYQSVFNVREKVFDSKIYLYNRFNPGRKSPEKSSEKTRSDI